MSIAIIFFFYFCEKYVILVATIVLRWFMETENKKMRIDRIEEGFAVAIAEDGGQYALQPGIADLKESDIILAKINECGEITAVKVLEEETSAKKAELHSRLKNLFNK